MVGGFYKHNKSGRVYKVGSFDIINTTNAQDGQKMVMYFQPLKPLEIFVREKEEFEQKFTLIKQEPV